MPPDPGEQMSFGNLGKKIFEIPFHFFKKMELFCHNQKVKGCEKLRNRVNEPKVAP